MPQFAAAPATADLHFSLPLTIKLFPALLLPFYYYFFCVIIIIIFVPQLWHKLAAAFFTNRIRIFAATNARAAATSLATYAMRRRYAKWQWQQQQLPFTVDLWCDQSLAAKQRTKQLAGLGHAADWMSKRPESHCSHCQTPL